MNFNINTSLQPLTNQDNLQTALRLCIGFEVSHIPIIENEKLIGLVAKNDLESIENREKNIEEYAELLLHFYADETLNNLALLNLLSNTRNFDFTDDSKQPKKICRVRCSFRGFTSIF